MGEAGGGLAMSLTAQFDQLVRNRSVIGPIAGGTPTLLPWPGRCWPPGRASRPSWASSAGPPSPGAGGWLLVHHGATCWCSLCTMVHIAGVAWLLATMVQLACANSAPWLPLHHAQVGGGGGGVPAARHRAHQVRPGGGCQGLGLLACTPARPLALAAGEPAGGAARGGPGDAGAGGGGPQEGGAGQVRG